MEFGAESEPECIQWIEAIKNCRLIKSRKPIRLIEVIIFFFYFYPISYSKLISQSAELQEKYLHLTQLYETESKAKWQYMSQIEELSIEVKKLRDEVLK